MKHPCEDCPFRRDVRTYLTVERAISLALATRHRDSKFYCHETVDYSVSLRSKKHLANARICRGFAILRAQESGNRFVTESDLVYRSMGEMIAAYAERGH